MLLALILTPFTAPFRTFDLEHSSNSPSYDTMPKDKDGVDEKLMIAPALSLVAPTPTRAAFRDSLDSQRTDVPPLQPTGLRI